MLLRVQFLVWCKMHIRCSTVHRACLWGSLGTYGNGMAMEYQLIVGAQLERVSQAAVGCIWPELHLWMGWRHKTWCQWMVRDSEKGTRKKLVLEFLPGSRKSGNGWKMIWSFDHLKDDGVYSKYLRQQIEKEHLVFVSSAQNRLYWDQVDWIEMKQIKLHR